MASPDPAPLAFDDVVIDFAGRRLLCAGVPQPLEPKAFGVLALLAGTPGQAFSRDQILDAVWGHRHVTPGVLNRVMTLLRHALGEEAHTPRYLRTLHGVGYRFDLPAAWPALDRRDETGGEVPFSNTSPSGGPALGTPSPQRWRALGIGTLVVCVTVLIAAWWVRQSRPAAAPAQTATAMAMPTLIVMPLKPIGADSGERDIAAGLSDELISALAHIDGLRVIARESTSLAAAQSQDIATLVPQLGISHALEGSLRQSGEKLRVHLRLTEARSGRTLWAQDYDRDVTDVLVLEREIAGAVATALTLRLGLPSLQAAKGGDAEFLRRYQAVRAAMRRQGPIETLEKVETELRELNNLRPLDARVVAALAFVLDARAFGRPHLAEGLRTEALREAAKAIRLDPALPEPYHVQATAACRDNAWERCLALNRKAMAMDPSASTSRFSYAMSLASLGYLDRAEAVMRAGLAKDPLNRGWHYGYGRVLDTIGEHERARAEFERAAGFNAYGPWFNAVWRRDYVEAMRHAQAMDENPRDRTYGPMLKKTHVAATEAMIDPRLWPQARAEGLAFERQTGMMDFLRAVHPDADAAAVIDGLGKVRQRNYSTWDLLLWTRDLAYLRRDPAFQHYLLKSGILAYWKKHGFPRQCRVQDERVACE